MGAEDVKASIEANAQAPKSFREGLREREAVQHSIKDQIAAYDFLSKQTAAVSKKPWRFIRYAKGVPPGAAD